MKETDWLALQKWQLIKKTGWTVEYVDALPLGKLYELYQLEDALHKVNL